MIDHAKSGMASSARKQRRRPERRFLRVGWPLLALVLLLAALNLFCGLVALAFALPSKEQPPDRHLSADGGVPERRLNRALFFTGLLGIGYEVLGVRALSQVLEGTVYSFAFTLAVYLLGASAGAALYQLQFRRMHFEPLKSWLMP